MKKAVETPPMSAFVGHSYVQHASGEWSGEHCIRYRSNLMGENCARPDAVASVYEDSLGLRSKKAAKSLERGLD